MAQDHFADYHSQGVEPRWNFNVLFDDHPTVRSMAENYASALLHPGLYPPIPPRWLHSTILAVGPVERFSETEMMTVVDTLEPQLAALQLTEFMFDSWWIWGGVVLHITPEDQLTRIYDLVIESLESIVGPTRTRKTPHGSFMSHLSLAYTRSHHQEHEIHKNLSNNPVQSAKFNIKQLSLIKQFPKDGHYEWNVVKNLKIGTNSKVVDL